MKRSRGNLESTIVPLLCLFQGSSSLLQELIQAKELARSAQEDADALATKAEKERS